MGIACSLRQPRRDAGASNWLLIIINSWQGRQGRSLGRTLMKLMTRRLGENSAVYLNPGGTSLRLALFFFRISWLMARCSPGGWLSGGSGLARRGPGPKNPGGGDTSDAAPSLESQGISRHQE
jgi:hypothetical protein